MWFLQGAKFIHADRAIAYDVMEKAPVSEINTRARMTLRNLQGTMNRMRNLSIRRHYGYILSLMSHKILKWFSPFFVIFAFLSSMVLSHYSIIYQITTILALTCFVLAFLGYWSEKSGKHIPFTGFCFSFLIANIGFLLGVIRYFRGEKIVAYRAVNSNPGANQSSPEDNCSV